MSRRILLFTGDGKGKTTAALGVLMRASGHGQRVLMIQFIKSDQATGELAAARHLPGVTILQAGRGFVAPRTDPRFAEDLKCAHDGLKLAQKALTNNECDLLILDEICVAISMGLLEEQSVLDLINQAPPKTCIVLTGRNAPPGLSACADTVTEMRCQKYGRDGKTYLNQAGVEF